MLAGETKGAALSLNRIVHQYKAGDKVLILTVRMDPKLKINQEYRVQSYRGEQHPTDPLLFVSLASSFIAG